MSGYSIERLRRLYSLNKAMVEGEIDFSRTVLFSSEIDLTEIEKVRASRPKESRPSYTALVARAIALALREYPYANRRIWHPWGLPFLSFFQSFAGTDIAVAIERDVPGYDAVAYLEVLRDVHERTLDQVTDSLRSFARADLESSPQWRAYYRLGMHAPFGLGGLIARLPWFFPGMWRKYRGGAAMISSPAKYGVDAVVAAWTHPVSFSFGLVRLKPMVRDGQVVAAPAFSFVMDWDRRVMAGAQAARFFARVCELLRQPAAL